MNSIFISFIQYKMIWDSLGFKNNEASKITFDFLTYRLIFDDMDPSSLWKLPRNCYEINLCKFVCKSESASTYTLAFCAKGPSKT